jgi:hypothetical protein
MRSLVVAVLLLVSHSASLFAAESDYAFTAPDGSVRQGGFSREDRYIVEFSTTVAVAASSARSRAEILARFQHDLQSVGKAAIRHRFRHVYFGASVEASPADAALIRALPYVKAIHRVERFEATAAPRATAAWRKASLVAPSQNGEGITVAILDTGIDYRHVALGGGLGPSFKVVGGWDFVNDDADPMDDQGHGTHVAGIVAGSSAEVRGVAPSAKLVAFKVLGATGSGTSDDIVAAVDRTVDLNGDGFPGDIAHVANMSLGNTFGAPGDPVITAVENAIAAGVVFCVAAGNSSDYWTVGSPGSAPSAITVGASDSGGALAPFSSKGPGRGSYSIKPEILAPGVQITSARVGGGVLIASGTSMASPYVAGVAAIIRSLRPGWTPEQVKSAIVNTAAATTYEVMEAGAGTVDRAAATTTVITTEPATLGFGLFDLFSSEWTPERSFTVTNHGPSRIDMTLTSSGGSPGFRLDVTPATVSLGAGETRDITVKLTATNDDIAFPEVKSFSYGGTIDIAAGGGATRVPWAFLKAARATFSLGSSRPAVTATSGQTFFSAIPNGIGSEVEVLLRPGLYDFLIYTDDDSPSSSSAMAILREQEPIEREHRFNLEVRHAPHLLTFGATDQEGVPLSARPRELMVKAYDSRVRILYPAGSALTSADLSAFGITQIRLSTMSDRFTIMAGEGYADAENGHVYVVQHRPLRGLLSSTTLSRTGDLVSREVRLLFPSDSPANRVVLGTRSQERFGGGYRWRASGGAAAEVNGDVWQGRAWITEDVDARFSYAPFISGMNPFPWIDVPALHASGGRVAAYDFLNPTPLTFSSSAGQALLFGEGPVRLQLSHIVFGERFEGFLGALGPHDERRGQDVENLPEYTIYDGAGSIVAAGQFFGSSFGVTIPATGIQKVEVRQGAFPAGGTRGKATLTHTIDTRRADSMPPVITALRLEDESGSSSKVLYRGRLLLGIADVHFTPEATEYDNTAGRELRAFVRRSGTSTWTPLPLQELGLSVAPPAESGYAPIGAMFRADLTPLGTGQFDLKLISRDSSGNGVEYVLEPAFRTTAYKRRMAAR